VTSCGCILASLRSESNVPKIAKKAQGIVFTENALFPHE
jgi:hypothetical protein